MQARLRWWAPTLVLGIAVLLRFWALDRPATLVFDELYYVRDAISQLAHGFPTTWPDSDPSMAGERATAMLADPTNAVHPPLGKWLIGLGILVFGPESGWGWRSASALAGVLTVGIVMRLGWLMTRSLWVASIAGLILAIDGVHIVLSRVGLLDGFLTLFVALGALLMWRDQAAVSKRLEHDAQAGHPADGTARPPIPVLWARPWLIAAGAAFGAAAAVKWSGLYPLAAFLIFITIRDLLTRLRSRTPHPVRRSIGQAGAAALLALPAALLTYLASWIGWIVNPGGWGRTPGVPWPTALLQYHREMLAWHGTLSAPHPYQSHPLTWPLALRPTAMYEQREGASCAWNECVAAISPLPNPLITWGGVLALAVLGFLAVAQLRRARRVAQATTGATPFAVVVGFVCVGYLSGWLPWVATVSRSAVFQFYAVVLTPFAALALALLLAVLWRVERVTGPQGLLPRPAITAEEQRGRRISVGLFVALAVVLAAFFFPVWSASPVAEWFWRAHLWLPGWS